MPHRSTAGSCGPIEAAAANEPPTSFEPGDALCWSFPANRSALGSRLSPFGVAHGITFGDGTRFKKGACVDLHGEKNAELLKWFPLSHT